MLDILSVVDMRFILMVLAGSVAGLFVGAIPGLSVSMATALLVSVTYTWEHSDALAMIMGVYVVGVFSGAVSAILINIPGAPSSVVTTLDGYPMSKKGQAYKALYIATIYSFTGSLFGLLALGLLATPVSRVALKFTKMDYCDDWPGDQYGGAGSSDGDTAPDLWGTEPDRRHQHGSGIGGILWICGGVIGNL